MYDMIFFDLDGTLTDSAPGILNAIRYALERAEIPVPPAAALYRFIGPPLMTEFQAAFQLGPEQAEALVRDFQVYFRGGGMFENRVYGGVEAMLQRLSTAGCRMAVTTSKPEPFARQILEHFGLSRYFAAVVGSAMDEKTRATKSAVVAHACKTLAPDRPLMVGDRSHDVEGAHANGVDCLGVLYGYGSREELSGANYLAESVEALAERLAALCGGTGTV